MDSVDVIIGLSLAILVVIIVLIILVIVFGYFPAARIERIVDQATNDVVGEIHTVNNNKLVQCFVKYGISPF